MNKFRTLTEREIECRIAQTKKNGLQLLLYKDARCDQAILDETVGPMNWMRHHSRDNANCIVAIWDDEKKQWVEKEDTGTESNTEAEKGLASDSFKRACVNWGIGRELYTSPFIWVSAGNCKIEEDQQGRVRCKDRFEVSEIGYNDHREINHLRVVNSNSKAVVYSYDEKPEKPEKQADVSTAVECDRCGKIITGAVLDDGSTMTAPEIIAKSKLAFGAIYCAECMATLEEKKPVQHSARKMATDEQKMYIRNNASDADYEAIMRKYGTELERLTSTMAERVMQTIDDHNRAAG